MPKSKRAELTARTYVLRIVPERAKEVSRTVELLGTQKLEDLHDCIQREFALDHDHLYAFFMSGRAWDRSSSYEGPGRNAAGVTLQAAGCKPGRDFLYIFDFGDELRHQIHVESQGSRELGVSYPRTLASVGQPPPQYAGEEEDPALDADLLPLADEVADACAEQGHRFDSDKSCEQCGGRWHRHVEAETLARFLELEERLRRALRERPQQIAAMEAHCEWALLGWLSDLFFDLAESQRGDEALTRYAHWLALLGEDAEEQLGSRAKLLLRAGYREEAKAEAERRLERAPDDFYTLSIAADICQECGDLERAETISRRHYELAKRSVEPDDLAVAGCQLAQLLRVRGKTEEAAALEQSLEESFDHTVEDEDDDEAPISSLVPVASAADHSRCPPTLPKIKIGRNQPCPCGSSKKYKKCCGA